MKSLTGKAKAFIPMFVRSYQFLKGNALKVTSVEATPVSIPLSIPFVVWRGPITQVDRVIVRIATDEGITGYGESAVLPYYAEESQKESVVSIREDFAAMIVGQDPFELERITKNMDLVTGHHCTKAALETALWDVIGKNLDLPVYKLIGGRYNDRLPVVGVVTLGTPEETAAEAKDLARLGHQTIKLKGGLGLDKDVRNFRAAREAVGPSIKIRIDVEENYIPKIAIKMIEAIEPYDPELVSQPVSRFDIDGLRMVRKAVSTPILADECIFGPEDVMSVVRREAADMINIKVMKSGGVYNSRKMASIAEMADLPCLIGSMIELGPGTFASAQFMTATRNAGSLACELVGSTKIKDDVIKEPMKIKNGFMSVPNRPGLGFEIDESKLEKYHSR
jgi:L-alanine-DL-glutamate epimerase-like enolase superfamily enzyme